MKYLKLTVAYFSLMFNIMIFVNIFLQLFGIVQMSDIVSYILVFIISPIFTVIYHKWRPFKLTGNLDLYLKEKWDNYLDSQKTCLNCNKVVKSSEIKNGICKSCRDLDNKNSKFGYKRKERNER
ncbi:hypothetical protein ACNSOP_07510 [Aliarcobacter lanthieri]|uniref:hypothetical protein n=1 Tax=Aliarcobacter lanthieri TaxID=1355374 RepID=UPI003AA89387